jgi:hypothetical protein
MCLRKPAPLSVDALVASASGANESTFEAKSRLQYCYRACCGKVVHKSEREEESRATTRALRLTPFASPLPPPFANSRSRRLQATSPSASSCTST